MGWAWLWRWPTPYYFPYYYPHDGYAPSVLRHPPSPLPR
jgi:hypothetical protein